MCNRARFAQEPETLGATDWWTEKPRDNRFNPTELYPKSRAYVVREQDGRRGIDVMTWDVLGGGAKWPMTNVRKLSLSQWRRLAEKPENRCLQPEDEERWLHGTYDDVLALQRPYAAERMTMRGPVFPTRVP